MATTEKLHEHKPNPAIEITCPQCKSETGCFEEKYPEQDGEQILGYLCKNCGYTSTSQMVVGSAFLNTAINSIPKLVQDNKFYDEERNLYWFLAIVQTNKGAVFPEANEESWHWTYIPVKELTEEEMYDYPVEGAEDTYHTHVMLEEDSIKFDKNEFNNALTELGMGENNKS